MLSQKIKETVKKQTAPLWEGPCSKGPQGGITYSLLSRFLVCRERSRLLLVEGRKGAENFSAALEFGNFWHTAEEAIHSKQDWKEAIEKYRKKLTDQFRFTIGSREEILHWARMTEFLFKEYLGHYKANEVGALPEQVFCFPYELPSGNVVYLRGKRDLLFTISSGKDKGNWLQENKSKSSIDLEKISRQLTRDLQTMMYLITCPTKNLRGVRYNVVRRSAHKTVESAAEKFNKDRKDGRIGEWFSRWLIEVPPTVIERFKKETLNPILETLVQWWSWITTETCDAEVLAKNCHWVHPFGVYNVLNEGGATDLDNYLRTGSLVGLQKTSNLFPELCQ